MIMGSNVQVVWEKFCRYWDVEPRYLPMERGRYVITPEQVVNAVDENTIGVVAILGTTFTGEFEPIQEIHDALVKLNADKGWEVPLHVDGASGAFVAPFLHPDLAWDFRLPLVKSINASGHKYGLVYPGVGWVMWRSHEDLPEELVFHVNYLGGDMPTFTLNFSRAGNQVVGQYYNFLRLGRAGYTTVMETLRDIATWLSGEIAKLGPFELLSDGSAIPVFAFKLRDGLPYSVYDLSDKLRQQGWQVPAYTMPEGAEDVAVLRVVVREGFSRDLADELLEGRSAKPSRSSRRTRPHRPPRHRQLSRTERRSRRGAHRRDCEYRAGQRRHRRWKLMIPRSVMAQAVAHLSRSRTIGWLACPSPAVRFGLKLGTVHGRVASGSRLRPAWTGGSRSGWRSCSCRSLTWGRRSPEGTVRGSCGSVASGLVSIAIFGLFRSAASPPAREHLSVVFALAIYGMTGLALTSTPGWSSVSPRSSFS